MARARNIKPGFFKNEDLAECSPWARLCFAGLWILADREGRLEDRPKRIKGELFAYDSVEVEPLLAELETHKFLVRYRNEDGAFIQISKFSTHQTPHYSEKDSVIKPPEFQERESLDGSKNPGRADKLPAQTPREAEKTLYFAQRGGPTGAIKIGVSSQVDLRARRLQYSGGPDALEILLEVAQSAELNERVLHTRFAEHRIQGEWFSAAPEVMQLIADVLASSGGNSRSDGLMKRGSQPPDSLIPDSLIPDSPPDGGKARKRALSIPTPRSKPQPTQLPKDWQPDESVVAALAMEFNVSQGVIRGPYLSGFRDACSAKGYAYVDFNAAFRNCVRQDWPKVRSQRQTGAGQGNSDLHDLFRRGREPL